MSYKIVVDSCGELTPEMKADGHFVTAPLSITVDSLHILDDDTFDQKSFLRAVADSPNPAKIACPSPELYEKEYEETDADHIYAVTLSAALSGSYNSAQLARSICLEEHPEKKIHVFNSKSASAGETLIAQKIQECEEQGMSFEDTIETVDKYIEGQVTWFVLENLETLRKNGRLSNLKAKFATALKIKPVMTSTPEGSIAQLCQCRGMNKALVKMVENIAETVEFPESKTVGIAHCNCPERAQIVAEAIRERIHVKDLFIVNTAGISSTYANDGGIIVVV